MCPQVIQLRVFNGTALSALSPITNAQAAQTYAIQVSGRNQGTFTLNVAPVVQPPNDHFTNAFTLTGSSASATGTGLAPRSSPVNLPIRNDGSVWWNWNRARQRDRRRFL
jgi:hypothetical protein